MRAIPTEIFKRWFIKQNPEIRRVVNTYVKKVELGNFSSASPVGNSVHEIKINKWKGVGIYFTNVSGEIILLLCGGDKSSQQKDIQKAIRLKENL
jgi:putative addiction module killer protein